METMYNAFYLTKSSMPRSFYNRNNLVVSERESPFFEQQPGAVCPFFAEIALLGRIKNSCPVKHFDGSWVGTKAFKRKGPRADSGLKPMKGSILSRFLEKSGNVT